MIKDCFDYSLVNLESEKHTCPGELESFNFEILNDGDYAETYDLSIDGNYPGQVTLSQGAVSISPGNSAMVEIYVEPTEDSLGNYEFSLVVDPNTGNSIKSSEVLLVVDPCYDFSISTDKDSVSICEHTQDTLSILVENQGSTSNVYNLDLEGPAWASLENNKLTVGPDSTSEVILHLSPDYGVEGNFEVIFKATPEMGSVQAMNVFSININKCHDVTVDVEKESDTICNSLENNYNVNIVNNGEYDKEYYLELNAPDWVDLDQRSISLSVGEDTQVNLIVNPGYSVDSDTYDISVSAHAKDSSKVASTDLISLTTVTREECYKVALSSEDDIFEIYSDSTGTIPVVVENMGSDKATYELSVGGTAASFVYLNPSIINLDESKSELVYMYVAPTEKISPGSYTVSVSARLEDSTILDSQTIEVLVMEPTESFLEEESEVTGMVTLEVEDSSEISPFMKIIAFFKNLFSFGDSPIEDDVLEVDLIMEDLVQEEDYESEILEDELEVLDVEALEIQEDLTVDSNLMELGDSLNFNINEEEHTLSFEDKNSESVLILISSDPIYVALDICYSKEIDVDND